MAFQGKQRERYGRKMKEHEKSRKRFIEIVRNTDTVTDRLIKRT